jgi:cytochrome c oxidase cbb3-type subunit 3
MKFINYLTSITGVEIFPLLSLLIFFLFFLGLTLYVIGVNKSHVAYMSSMPVESSEESASSKSETTSAKQ